MAVKKDIITLVKEKTNFSKKDIGDVIDAFLDAVVETISAGEDVRLNGFGTFTIIERAEREGVNPSTREKIIIPATKVPKFKPSATLKEAVKND